jgi:hypothetical protein
LKHIDKAGAAPVRFFPMKREPGKIAPILVVTFMAMAAPVIGAAASIYKNGGSEFNLSAVRYIFTLR